MLLRKTFLENTRRLYAGQSWKFTHTKFDESFSHHKSHVAGFYTSPFHNANILVVDAIGEWDKHPYGMENQGSLKLIEHLKRFIPENILEFSGVTIFTQ